MSEAYQRIRKNRRRKAARRRRLHQILLNLGIVAVILAVVFLFPHIMVKGSIRAEAGDAIPQASAFFRFGGRNAEYVEGSTDEVDMDTIGKYQVKISFLGGWCTVRSAIRVQDTTSPLVTLQDVTIWLGEEAAAADFVASVSDATQTEISYVEAPDFSAAGSFEVTIAVTDAGGNVTQETALLTITEDTEAPVIEGVEELTTTQGGTISYKSGVTVTDNLDEEPTLTIDTSQVDLNTVGDYEVTYTATDSAGNSSSVTTTVHVETPTIDTATEDTVAALADELLEDLIDDDMSQYEIIYAIYWWCHDHIAYKDMDEHDDWVRGAYMGLVNRQGDCFTYASTAKILLTQAGIENLDIEKVPTSTSTSLHFWNLVNIGDGWYHFDTTRRSDGSTFFYLTDEELMEYSDAHGGTHNYDASLYPDIE